MVLFVRGVGVAEAGVDEEDDFEEVGGAADPRCLFEAAERCWAHGGGIEGFREDAGSGEG